MTGRDDAVDVARLRRAALLEGVGDGVAAVALPLLAAGVTRDPLAVAAVLAAQHVPWPLLLVSLPALRHVDRRTLAGLGGSLRAVAVGLAGVLAVIGGETILTIQLVALALGTAQALADEAARSGGEVLPERAGTSAHAALSWAGMLGMGVVGLPLGGALYELLAAVPLLFDVGVFAVAALLALAVRRPLPAGDAGVRGGVPAPAPGSAGAVGAGALVDAGGGAVAGVLVLLALDDLGLGAPAFGLLLAGLAASSAVGALVAPTAGHILGLRTAVALALLVDAAGLVAAWATLDPELPYPAVVGLGVAAGGGMLAAVLLRAARHQRSGPIGEAGRAGSLLPVWAATPVGALAGGVVARSVEPAGVLLCAAAVVLLAAVVAALATGPGRSGSGARPAAAETSA